MLYKTSDAATSVRVGILVATSPLLEATRLDTNLYCRVHSSTSDSCLLTLQKQNLHARGCIVLVVNDCTK